MIYLDTSSLLKLLHLEPESAAVQQAVAAESEVLISALVRLEARIQLKAGWLGGDYRKARYHTFVEQLDRLGELEPFRFVAVAGSVFATAIRQDSEAAGHLRSLDRLHLAAMEDLGVKRLMTHDANQAAAARALGFDVFSPK